MFDVFKKPEEEQDYVEVEATETNEISEVTVEAPKEKQSEEVKTHEPFESAEADLLITVVGHGRNVETENN